MNEPLRVISTTQYAPDELNRLEWLVTNGLGGYASGTLSGVVTRRYHGYLIAALPAPHGRVIMLNQICEQLKFPDRERYDLGGQDDRGNLLTHGTKNLTQFRLEMGMPVWSYKVRDTTVEKRVWMAQRQNTVFVQYCAKGGPVALRLTPAIHFRYHDAPVSEKLNHYVITADDKQFEIAAKDLQFPPLRLRMYGEEASFTVFGRVLTELVYRLEESRGYEYKGQLWSPGHFWVDLEENKPATLVASSENWDTVLALAPDDARKAEGVRRRRLLSCADRSAQADLGAELLFAADQFIISPVGRTEDLARARAVGDEVRSIIAGYHWFTDWGRDTMISLEGLTLVTNRHHEAAWILRMFAQHVRDGLIPNFFPEGDKEGVYHTSDATMWFFEAIARYLDYTDDRATLEQFLPKLIDIVDHHLKGTRFGIGVDPDDGLVQQGAEGYQLTWMDAKVGDWVVTPRRGKPVEINALWYNALCLLEGWLRDFGKDEEASNIARHASRARESFNRRFWNPETRFLFDVVDGEHGNDPRCRPNQVFAISLRHPVLDRDKWKPVMDVVEGRLVTPVGLRSLARGEPDYKERYFGDLRSRDAAYHQGTVWAWLIGAFVDAWIKLYPDKQLEASKWLKGFYAHQSEACVGSISEIFDAEPPFTPRGCIAQAWSVAEVLRCWVKTSATKPEETSERQLTAQV